MTFIKGTRQFINLILISIIEVNKAIQYTCSIRQTNVLLTEKKKNTKYDNKIKKERRRSINATPNDQQQENALPL
jgi:hypothetical protein